MPRDPVDALGRPVKCDYERTSRCVPHTHSTIEARRGKQRAVVLKPMELTVSAWPSRRATGVLTRARYATSSPPPVASSSGFAVNADREHRLGVDGQLLDGMVLSRRFHLHDGRCILHRLRSDR